MSKAVLAVIGGKSAQLQIGDETLGKARFLSGDACQKLQATPGKTIQLRDPVPEDNPKGWNPRAGQIGSYDGKGKLTIATGYIGKPISDSSDIAEKEEYQVEPGLFDAFCAVFEATSRDGEAVQAIMQKGKKTEVVEVKIKL